MAYLSLDDTTTHMKDSMDEMLSVNFSISNKFYDVMNPSLDKHLLRRCSETGVILPQYLLKEIDRVRPG
jgi:hypothetical protein